MIHQALGYALIGVVSFGWMMLFLWLAQMIWQSYGASNYTDARERRASATVALICQILVTLILAWFYTGPAPRGWY